MLIRVTIQKKNKNNKKYKWILNCINFRQFGINLMNHEKKNIFLLPRKSI